jgi:hypothetical protein
VTEDGTPFREAKGRHETKAITKTDSNSVLGTQWVLMLFGLIGALIAYFFYGMNQ